jgi:hypothetical protein
LRFLEAKVSPNVFAIARPGVDFRAAIATGITADANDEAAAALQAALAEHAVVCIRMERALLDDEFQAVARLFGPIKNPVGRTKDGALMRYDQPRQIIDSGFVMTDEVREKLGDIAFGGLDDQRPGLFETYHCDDT